ncbi:MAG TPA: hypothetical protein VGR28_05755 [Candidatus Thermoplasmatota archaeon]|jgi:hypothetical protein|nr:hypothetical protein [Candidatus Thermoplasmatota archaeon]
MALRSGAIVALAVALALPVGALGLASLPAATAAPPPTPGQRIHAELEHAAQLAGVAAAPLDLGPCPDFETAVRQHYASYRLRAPDVIPTLGDPALEHAAACLLDAMRAADLVRHAMLQQRGIDLVQLMDAIVREDDDALAAMPHLDVSIALGAAFALADRADAAIAALKGSPAPATRGTLGLPEMDMPPVIAIDRTGPTLYDCSYALVLDEVGDDLYDNNAGGSWLALGNMPIFFLSALPDRCSEYIVPLGPEDPTVAVGGEIEFGFVITAAMLIDTQGSDSYGVRRAPVIDAPCTSEPVVRRIGAQGAGIIGPGLLIDTDGDNHFVAKTLSQGLGHSGGVGVLYLGPGDDTLEAVRSAQGAGVLGAIGVLINEAGNDSYIGRVPAGGTLNIDLGICDDTSRYVQGAGFGRITGIAASIVGILRDLEGNDYYQGDFKIQGAGEVFAHGVLLDEAGNDVYVAQGKAMGYGEGHSGTGGTGSGWFLDRGGDDLYLLGSAPGLGMGDGHVADPAGAPAPYIPPNLWANDVASYFANPLLLTGGALFVDERGTDTYSLATRGNGMVQSDSLVGVFVDQ